MKAAAVTAGAAAAVIGIERRFAAPKWRGPISDHFDGKQFVNLEPGKQSDGSFLKWQLTKTPGAWPKWIDAPYGPPPPARVGNGALRVTWINHATLLVQIDGMNILTDPIWSDRCSPVRFLGPKRRRPPGLRFDDLPPIDLVLISHNHYDHLDLATLRALQERHAPRILTPLGNAAFLAREGIGGAEDLDWWEGRSQIAGLRSQKNDALRSATGDPRPLTVTCVPAQHFSSRALSDRNANLWGGFVIGSPSGNVYFAGDTGWGRHFAMIGERFAPIRLAMLPIGAYLPRWFMRPVHMDPAEAVEAHLALRAKTSVAMHYGTWKLGDDGEREPVDDLHRALAERGNAHFEVLEHGIGFDAP